VLDGGLALLGAGLVWLLPTLWHARTREDVVDSEQREAELRKEIGFLANGPNQMEWVYRATYRHPVLMRLPGALLVGAGVVLLVIAAL
jgi:hypothetical protein